MGKYRKKPVVIEAMQFTGEFGNYDAICDWSGVTFPANTGDTDTVAEMFIRTLEGEHRADVGDWIVKGVKGEFYPCKPDIFEQTYEAAE